MFTNLFWPQCKNLLRVSTAWNSWGLRHSKSLPRPCTHIPPDSTCALLHKSEKQKDGFKRVKSLAIVFQLQLFFFMVRNRCTVVSGVFEFAVYTMLENSEGQHCGIVKIANLKLQSPPTCTQISGILIVSPTCQSTKRAIWQRNCRRQGVRT